MDKMPLALPIQLGETGQGSRAYYYPASGELVVGERSPVPRALPAPSDWELDIAWHVNRLAFTLTMQCNLNCSYCYNRFNEKVNGLTPEMMFKAIDDLAMQPGPLDSVGLIFSGGEPLLREKDFMALAEYAGKIFSNRGIPLNVTLYTNGTLLDDSMIDFLSDRHINVIISLDGPQAVHDRYRVMGKGASGFKTTVRNLRKMVDRGMGHLLQTRAVICDAQADIVDVMESSFAEGITRVHLMPVYGMERRLIAGGLNAWLLALKVYESLLIKGVVIEVSPFYRIFRKLLYPRRFADSHFPCTAGKAMLGVGSDGFYYLCHHYSGSGQRFGRVGEGLPEPGSYRLLTPSVEQREPCRLCWARHLCGGPCYHREYIGSSPLRLEDCSQWRELLRQTALAFCRLSAQAPDAMRIIARGLVYMPERIRTESRKYRNAID